MKSGFSLVELSIVLVILGLLTGGILAGQSLIRAAELRGVSTEFSKHITSIYTFRDKYFALPGDMTNGTKFWGVRAAGTNLVCQTTVGVTAGTCDSDGNGQINAIAGDTAYQERFLAWQHLAKAGLIEGSFTGASVYAGTQTFDIGVNVPRSKISTAVTYFAYRGPASGNAEWFDAAGGSNLIGYTGTPKPLTPSEAWNIDTKMDDGKPALGTVFTNKATGTWTPGCATNDTLAAEYALSSSGNLCALWLQIP